VKSDTLQEIVDVACEIVIENAPDPRDTRVERMARWVVQHLGHPRIMTVDPPRLVGVIDAVTSEPTWYVCPVLNTNYTPEQAREVAAMLLEAADAAERMSR
jgi:hypothetical protein